MTSDQATSRPSATRESTTGEDVFLAFCDRARAVSAAVIERDSLEASIAYVAKLAASMGGPVAAPGLSNPIREALARHCSEAGVELVEEGLRHRRDLIVGVSVAVAGIASTGTLVMSVPGEDVRLASMIVETHVVLLERSRIVADLPAVKPLMTSLLAQGRGYVAFVTGPSRTADIEVTVTLGAHGPRALHIILMGTASALGGNQP